MKLTSILAVVFMALLLTGCARPIPQQKNSPYTQGNVTLKLKKGVTTMAQVNQVFGAPNIVTQDSNGNQVWIYQKDNVTVRSSGGSSGYFTILIAGVSSSSGSSYQTSSRTMTLTIYFDKNGKVRDFKSMSTSF